jgi:hypothetical protein
MPTHTRNLFSLAMSMVAGVAIMSLTTAFSASAQGTLSGCYVPNSGTVYRIKAAGLPDACRSKQHVEFTWSLQGPQGPAGPSGPTGPQGATGPAGGLVRTAVRVVQEPTQAIPPGGTGQAKADCPAGMVATGGGTTSSVPALRVTASFPFTTNDIVTSWTAIFENPNATNGLGQVYVVCVPAQ